VQVDRPTVADAVLRKYCPTANTAGWQADMPSRITGLPLARLTRRHRFAHFRVPPSLRGPGPYAPPLTVPPGNVTARWWPQEGGSGVSQEPDPARLQVVRLGH